MEASSSTTAPANSGINAGGSTKDPVDQALAKRKRKEKEDHAAKMKAARLVAKQSPMEVAKKWLSGLATDLSNARRAHGEVDSVTGMDEGLRKEYANQFAYHLESILKLRESIELLASGQMPDETAGTTLKSAESLLQRFRSDLAAWRKVKEVYLGKNKGTGRKRS